MPRIVAFNLLYLESFADSRVVRGMYVGDKDPISYPEGRLLIAMRRAGLLHMQPDTSLSPQDVEARLEASRCEGFVYTLTIGNVEVPALWEFPFSLNVRSLPGDFLPAGIGHQTSWRQTWPHPVMEAVAGFRCYPFNTGLIWAPSVAAQVYVEPVPENLVTAAVLANLKRVHGDDYALCFQAGYGSEPYWKVGAVWEHTSSTPLPHGLTLTEAIAAAREIAARDALVTVPAV